MSAKGFQFLILVLAMSTTAWAHHRLPVESRAEQGGIYVPRPSVAKTASLGFDALLSDYYWLQAVQVAGGDAVIGPEEADQLGRLIDVVTTLNPNVSHPYRFGAVWLTHSRQQVETGNRLLRRGIENHPDDWRQYFYLGFNHFYYLGEFDEAATAMEPAIQLEGRPPYLPQLVARLKSQSGGIEVSEVFLREILRTSSDERTRARAQVGLDEIEIEYKARHLDRAREAFKERAGRDLLSVRELVDGPHRLLKELPSAEPDAIPAELSRGSVWKLDKKTKRIVSSFLGKRYEVHFSGLERQEIESWKKDGVDDPTSEISTDGNSEALKERG